MKKNSRKIRINKVLSVVLIYALFLNEVAPFSRAMTYSDNVVSGNTSFAVNRENRIINSDLSLLPLKTEEVKAEREMLMPPSVKVTTSNGPGQSESSGFSIGSTDGMVDKFTGDFSYSLPLMSVEGYPVVLSYNSNVNMLSEASWVGLGWDLNVGSVSREMRGIPDEFNGEDIVERTFNQKDNTSDGTKGGGFFGFETQGGFGLQITALLGKYTNSYLGNGTTVDLGLQGQYSISNADNEDLFLAPSFNVGFSYDSKSGIGRSQSLGLSGGYGSESGKQATGNISFGQSSNSRLGLTHKTISLGLGVGDKSKTFNSAQYGASSTMTYGTATSVPRIQQTTNGTSDNFQFTTFLKIKLESDYKLSMGTISQDYTSESAIVQGPNQIIYQPAYGYMHSGKRKFDNHLGMYPIMDFNRGRDSEFSEEMHDLPFSVQTHDVFYVNASGIGGTFRPQRKDYGTYYDPNTEALFNKDAELLVSDNQTNVGMGLVFDVASPTSIGFGISYSTGVMKGEIISGNWNQTNVLAFNPVPLGNYFDEAVYFRSLGEHTPVDMSAWISMQNEVPVAMDVNSSGNMIVLTNNLTTGQTVNGPGLNNINGPTYSTTVFEPKTAVEVANGGTINLPYYNVEDDIITANQNPTSLPVNGGIRKPNHISAVEVVSPDGARYTYGTPVYNIVSGEVSFATGAGSNGVLPLTATGNMVTYEPLIGGFPGDNSTDNLHGMSNYFEKTEVPAYPHSFLLNQMTSSDYIDVGADGLTIDDIGSYYKFNHTCFYSEEQGNAFMWRMPMSNTTPQAFYHQGTLGSTLDDMGNYSYGEKEIWYTHSIESKNMVACFILEDRFDGHGVSTEDGGLEMNKPLKQLKRIVLYNRSEKLANPNAIPLQTIEFDYDYSLCLGDPSNFNTYGGTQASSGKLTLKEIRVYKGNSEETALATYSFEYGNNPGFDYADVDSWGTYKPDNNAAKPNALYPYAEQSELAANSNSRAWKLKAINNPAGGRVEIWYDSDRYGHVQTKRAMRYFDIYRMTTVFDLMALRELPSWDETAFAYESFHSSHASVADLMTYLGVPVAYAPIANLSIFTAPATPYTSQFGSFDVEAIPNNVVIFELDEPLSAASMADASQQIKDLYFKDPSSNPNAYLKDLMFKMHLEIKPGVDELVQQVAEISNDYPLGAFSGIFQNELDDQFDAIGALPQVGGMYKYGYVILDPVNLGNRTAPDGEGGDQVENGSLVINPLQLTALEHARQYLTDLVYGSCDGCDPNLTLDWKVFFGHDIYETMIKELDYAQVMNTGSCIVRLFEPDNVKFGGGARVGNIKYLDNWDQISGEYLSEYVWEYKYGESGEESGVAAFESGPGIDENPLYNWDTYVNIKKKFPDERKFTPTPIAYQLFPRPVVGYAHVEVLFNGGNQYGHSLSTFHTNKDVNFATKAKSTIIDKTAGVEANNLFTGSTQNLFGYTQGYVVETNDFHGKPNTTELFDNNGITISKSKYNYYDLDDQIPMVDRKGDEAMHNVALEYDIHADARFIKDKVSYNEFGIDFTLFWSPAVIFEPSFGVIAVQNSRDRSFYSHALIKHINRSAVLKGITTTYLGSQNEAENILYDQYTGQPVLTSLKDEFNDELFSMSYPAHWKYREFRELHEMVNTAFSMTVDASGTFIPLPNDPVAPGDQVFLTVGGNPAGTAIVAQEYPVPLDGSLFLITANGGSFSPGAATYTATIINSNRKNRLTEVMQNVVSKKIPFDATTSKLIKPEEVISSSALTYRDRLTILCEDPCSEHSGVGNSMPFGSFYNPYETGTRGDLVMDGQFAWQDERVNQTHPHGIRFDGTYTSTFNPFYDLHATQNLWLSIENPSRLDYDVLEPYQKWRKMSEVTVFDQFGKALESVDQIGVYSSVLYGYSNKFTQVPVAQAVNARQRDIAFDGFEDYNYYNFTNEELCPPADSHFDFKDLVNAPGALIALSTDKRHSGLASLMIPAGESATVTKEVGTLAVDYCTATDGADVGNNTISVNSVCACIEPFTPTPGDYIIGAWVNHETALSGAQISIEINGVLLPPMLPTGEILDGWQRLEGVFTIPATPVGVPIIVKLENTNSTAEVYFDDIRIHPFLAGMTTVVYDPKTMLPLATHDGYNYTTFYNYDENLNQVRVRVETVDGIRTITESESGGQKNY